MSTSTLRNRELQTERAYLCVNIHVMLRSDLDICKRGMPEGARRGTIVRAGSREEGRFRSVASHSNTNKAKKG